MEAFLSSHLLDGTLGRCFAFISVALLAGLYLWQYHFQASVPHTKNSVIASIMIGLTGAALSLNSTFFQLSESMTGEESVVIAWENLWPLLLETSYGLGWLSFCALLILAWFSVHKRGWLLVNIACLIACLSLNGHAAEEGMISFSYVVDVMHLACVTVWIGGLLFIVFARLTPVWKMEKSALNAFSRFILPVFLLAQVSGILRLVSEYFKSGGLNVAYLSVVISKILLVIGVCFCAASLRKRLAQKVFNANAYDDVLGVEFFLALLLLLAAAMLTQLPPI